MKEKWKNYDWQMVDNKILLRKMLISFLVIVSFGSAITYDCITFMAYDKINSYSELDYIYLDKLAEDIIKEDVGIDVSSLPDDVEYECRKKEEETVVKLELNSKKMLCGEHPTLKLKLSKDFKILAKHRNYNSKKHYLSNARKSKVWYSIVCSLGYWVIIWVVALEINGIASKVSSRKRKKF